MNNLPYPVTEAMRVGQYSFYDNQIVGGWDIFAPNGEIILNLSNSRDECEKLCMHLNRGES